jgi:MHS family proline/betaine transporter-like MFS transporter
MNNDLKLDKKIIISCFLASCLEIYDFVIFAFFVPVLQKNYFVFLEPSSVLIVSYVLFAIGFLFRPLGSLVFGYIGDVYGRKRALVLSVSLMGSCSLIMFLLPYYEVLGVTSCLIIVLVRIVQGLSVGGEFTGALIFAMEHSQSKNVGLIGGILTAAGPCGVLLATIVSNYLLSPELPEWSWRIAFLLGFSLAIVGYIIRTKLDETPLFQNVRKKKKYVPLFEGFKLFKFNALATILIAAANGTTFYFVVIFLPNYLKNTLGMDIGNISILLPLFIMFFSPLVGIISDKFSKKTLLIGSCLIMAMYLPLMLNMVTNYLTYPLIVLALAIYCLIMSTIASMSNILAVHIFPVEYRMSCTSFFYSIGMGLIGGTVPTVSAYLVKWFGNNPIYISLYVGAICFAAGIGFKLVANPVDNKHQILQNY